MTKKEVLDLVSKAYSRLDNLEMLLMDCENEARGVMNTLEEIPRGADEIEDDKKEDE